MIRQSGWKQQDVDEARGAEAARVVVAQDTSCLLDVGQHRLEALHVHHETAPLHAPRASRAGIRRT